MFPEFLNAAWRAAVVRYDVDFTARTVAYYGSITWKPTSQGDIEKRTGLPRCWNGHTVPSVETLEKVARAHGVPLYRLFYGGGLRRNLRICPSAKQR